MISYGGAVIRYLQSVERIPSLKIGRMNLITELRRKASVIHSSIQVYIERFTQPSVQCNFRTCSSSHGKKSPYPLAVIPQSYTADLSSHPLLNLHQPPAGTNHFLSMHSSADEHLGYFYVRGSTNNVSVKIHVQVGIFHFSCIYTFLEWNCWVISVCVTLWETAKGLYNVYHLHSH